MVLSKDEITRRIQSAEDRGVRLISKYTKTEDTHDWLCLKPKCGHKWKNNFSNVSRGNGCGRCAGKRINNDDIKERLKPLEKRNIRLIGKFNGYSNKNNFECLVHNCNYVWSATLEQLDRLKSGCPKCGRTRTGLAKRVKPDLTFARCQELETRLIRLKSEFTRTHDKHDFECMKPECNYVWSAVFKSVYHNGHGCPKCAGQAPTEEEKVNTKAHNFLRKKLDQMFRRGQIGSKIYKDPRYGSIFSHWAAQSKLIPAKPTEGNWHLDHIIPVSWFDFNDINQLKLCWCHHNLRWLAGEENTKRGNRMRPQDVEVLTDWHYSAINKASYAKLIPSAVC